MNRTVPQRGAVRPKGGGGLYDSLYRLRRGPVWPPMGGGGRHTGSICGLMVFVRFFSGG